MSQKREGFFSVLEEDTNFDTRFEEHQDFTEILEKKEFLKIKMDSLYVGDVKTFTNFTVSSKVNLPLENYNSLIVWCESFNEFITSAKYK